MNTSKNTASIAVVSNRRIPMSSLRKTSLVAGILYLLTFISIPTLSIYSSIHQPNYILGTGTDTAVTIGGLLEIIVSLAGIGTAIVLYPVLRKQKESVALGLVASRVLEAGTIFVGVSFMLTVVSLRQAGAGTGALVTSHTLVTMYDRIFLLGQGFIPAVNALLLGSLLYHSRLVPRILPIIGFAGAALLIAAYIGILFGYLGQYAPSTGLFAMPVALWEFSLGIYLVVKGFKPTVIQQGSFQI